MKSSSVSFRLESVETDLDLGREREADGDRLPSSESEGVELAARDLTVYVEAFGNSFAARKPLGSEALKSPTSATSIRKSEDQEPYSLSRLKLHALFPLL